MKLFGKKCHIPPYLKNLSKDIPFDSDKQVPVLKSSICTGEQSVGFRDIATGKYTEAMVIKSSRDLGIFREIYGLEDTEIKKEY